MQESGLARVLLQDIGLETVMKINRPAQPGDKLTAYVGYVDVVKGIYKFEEDSTGTAAMALDEDEEALTDETEASEASDSTTYA